MTDSRVVPIKLERRILFHPQGGHIRRMGSALWLYLALLVRADEQNPTIRIAPAHLARSMGLREGTIRSWLGHLTKGRYVTTEGRGETVSVTLRRDEPPAPRVVAPPRAFTLDGLARSLGDGADRPAIASALEDYADAEIRTALAGALAPPQERIRKSRTALFLYLLTHPHQ